MVCDSGAHEALGVYLNLHPSPHPHQRKIGNKLQVSTPPAAVDQTNLLVKWTEGSALPSIN